ncbi:MAG: hypothetical protein H6Q31_2531, partial [Bacteroidetes bacterium]|nr:hypothetical protein [Bacteroidota bacterium]
MKTSTRFWSGALSVVLMGLIAGVV